jgi:hypothetical protein
MTVSRRDEHSASPIDASADAGLTRRGFLGGLGGAAALGGAAIAAEPVAPAAGEPLPRTALTPGKPLRVLPVLTYAIPGRVEKTSWRPYGGLKSKDDVDAEARRIGGELQALAARAEFPVEFAPVALVGNDAEAVAAVRTDRDAILVYASGGSQGWLEALAASGKPCVMFVRHRSGPVYLWYEIAHYRFLRKSVDAFGEPNMDVDDVVVDDYGDVLWRLRALYGLVNARGTRVAALGGLQAYSAPAGKNGPKCARETWGYEIADVPTDEIAARIARARADAKAVEDARSRASDLLAQPGVVLDTERRFVDNSFLALRVFREILAERGASNLGVANCMGSLIGLLDTSPCLVLSLLNDEGFTAFCHVDLSHTMPGVLLRWISGKPSFVSNSHFPHHGMVTLAHCAAPRRMDGRSFEPSRIMTHFESDYGAATKVEYRKGQVTTNIVPNLSCTKWFAFRGKVLASPSMDMCRSQMDVEIDGDWKKLLRTLEGFHTVTCYGDYLREVGYALKKTKMGWEDVSA